MTKNTRTALICLIALLNKGFEWAEGWNNSLGLKDHPVTRETKADDILTLSAFYDWRWENWNEFVSDYQHYAELLADTKDCDEVHEAWKRFHNAMKPLKDFVDVAGELTDQCCR